VALALGRRPCVAAAPAQVDAELPEHKLKTKNYIPTGGASCFGVLLALGVGLTAFGIIAFFVGDLAEGGCGGDSKTLSVSSSSDSGRTRCPTRPRLDDFGGVGGDGTFFTEDAVLFAGDALRALVFVGDAVTAFSLRIFCNFFTYKLRVVSVIGPTVTPNVFISARNSLSLSISAIFKRPIVGVLSHNCADFDVYDF
jgi:hypothetical protein